MSTLRQLRTAGRDLERQHDLGASLFAEAWRGPDSDWPFLRSVATTNVSAGLATLNLIANTTSTGSFTVQPGSGSGCGSAAQVAAGQNSGGTVVRHGSLSLTANVAGVYTVRSLAQSSSYTVCLTLNGSSAPVSASFTTRGQVTPVGDWTVTGGVAATSIGRPSALVFGPDGTPYVASQVASNNSISVLKYSNGSWQTVGPASIATGALAPSLAMAPDGSLYLAFQDYGSGNKATVLRFIGSAWVTVGNADFTAGAVGTPSLGFAPDGGPYLAFTEGGSASVDRFNGSSWVPVGAPRFSGGAPYELSFAFSPDGFPYVAYRDYYSNNNQKATVMRFNGSAWQAVGGVSFSSDEAALPTLAFAPDGTTYLGYLLGDTKTEVDVFNGTSWHAVGNVGFSGLYSYAQDTDIAPDGTPYTAFENGSYGDKVTVNKYNSGAGIWQTVGSQAFSSAVAYALSLTMSPEGRPFVAYQNNVNGPLIVEGFGTIPVPVVTTNAATNVTTTGATLNGSVNPNGNTTSSSFEYGTTASYGTAVSGTTGANIAADSGTAATAVSLTGLTQGTTYHYRADAINIGGTGRGADATFTTAAIPAITSASPATGPTAGGTSVSITGTGFIGVNSVSFGSTAAQSFTVNSPTQISAVAPPHTAGTVNIIVTTTGGSSGPGPTNQYVYTITPAIITIPSGNGQSASIGAAFGAAVVVHVADAYGNAVPGVPVALSGPISGASAFLTPASSVTDSNGNLSVAAVADGFAGAYTILATSAAATGAFSLTNTRVATIVAAGASPTSLTYGSPVQLSATISPTGEFAGNPFDTVPAGTVTFYDGATPLSPASPVNSAAASYTVAAPSAGAHAYYAIYNGDANYQATAPAAAPAVTVGKASASVTLGSLSAMYDGNAHAATATTLPAGLGVGITYNGSATAPTAAGTYTVIATVTDSNYAGSATGMLIISPAAAAVTLSSLNSTYNGTPHPAMAATSPAGLVVSLTYNGSTTAPSAAGSYTVVGTVTTPNYSGTATGTLVISRATATVTLGNLAATYDSNPHAATATTSPVGLSVSLAYNGISTVPSASGSYTVVGTINDPNYVGAATDTLVIGKASGALTLGSLSATYTGSPQSATATTAPAGLSVSFTYNGVATVPSAAGSYTILGTISDPNYSGTATGTLIIAKATAAVTLGNLSAAYDGNPHAATATTSPAGLTVSLTYNGSSASPTAVGSYAVAGTVNDANYSGLATGTLVISAATATVALGSLATTYDGNPHTAIATTSPAGLTVTLTYDGGATAPTAAGSYTVVGTVSSPNYAGSASGTLVIARAAATVTLGSLSATYDSNPHAAAATTNPAGLAVSFTYNGSTAMPSAVGSYAVVGTVTDPNYTGSATGTLVISKAAATVALGNLSATYNGNVHAVSATTSPVGLTVTFTYNGSSTAPTSAGSYTVVATINDTRYSGSATGTLVISKAAATVTLGSLSAAYDGNPHAVSATTSPVALGVSFTYNGSAAAPTAVGSYAVVATISDSNYAGSTTGTLAISQGSAMVLLGSLSATYDGNLHAATATTTPAGLSVMLTYNGSSTPPSALGSYAVVGTISEPNYTGSATGTLTISTRMASVTLGSLSATYDGAAHAVTVTTNPNGLTVNVTYNGSATAPVAAGSYAVAATVSDPSYSGSASGTLVISKASASVALSGLSASYNGSPQAVTAATVPAGLAVAVTYNGSAIAPSSVGWYSVLANLTDANYIGAASGTLVIAKGTGAVTLGGLSATYDGSTHAATATTTPAGLIVSFTYDGSAAQPSAAGSYTVISTIVDGSYSGFASGTLVIARAPANVTISPQSFIYDGNPHAASVYTMPGGLATSVTYNGSATVPSAVGSYTVVATVTDGNYTGSGTGTLIISSGNATVTLANLSATYDGTAHATTAVTNPAGLAITFTYNGSATPPTAAGSYTVIATINDPHYNGSVTGTLTIAKAAATVTLGTQSFTYDGNPHAVSVGTTPAGLATSVTYNGSAGAPSAVGTYAVVGTVTDPNYAGSATATLTITSANATVTLGNLNITYDGSAHAVTTTTNPAGLAVRLTYNGSASAPTAAGSYTAVATIDDPHYNGTNSATLVIAKAAAGVTLNNQSFAYDGSPHAAMVTTTPAGLPVSITYSGSATIPSSIGNYTVASTVTDSNYSGSATATLNIVSGNATVTLGNLSATYDGNSHASTASTNPAGLTIGLTYNGAASPPSAAGSYTVVATVSDPRYTGSATGTLVIAKAPAIVTLGNLMQSYDGTPHNATVTTVPASVVTSITYNGSANAPSAVGTYTVVASVIDPNYTGSATGTLAINSATATVTLGSLNAIYDGAPHAASVTTNPAGLSVTMTYNGSASLPVAAGSYAVVANVSSSTYSGSASGIFTIAKANATVSFGNLNATFDGNQHAVTTATVPAGLTVLLSYNGAAAVPFAAGNYAVAASLADANYTGSASATLTVSRATTTLTLGSSATTIDPGQAVTLTAAVSTSTATAPGGQVLFYDNGAALGSFAVVAGQGNPTASVTTTLSANLTHSIVATYGGDANFLPSSSNASGISVTVRPLSFTFAGSSPTAVSVPFGSNRTATYTFAIAPLSNSSYPGSITFAADGIPRGATYTFSPSTVAPTAGPQTITLTVQVYGNVAGDRSPDWSPFGTPVSVAALLLLPFLRGKRARSITSRRLLTLLFAFVLPATIVSTSGCGSGVTAGFAHTIYVTAQGGGQQKSVVVNLLLK